MDSRVVGILGGGQLGRMLVEAANRLNIETIILDSENSPAKQISNSKKHINGSFSIPEDIKEIASKCDVLTVEIEHVDVPTLKTLEKEYPNLKIYPTPDTIGLIQDKYTQKEHLLRNDIKITKSLPIETPCKESLMEIGKKFGYPFMLKSRTLAYDGRGNFIVKDVDHIDEALKVLANRPLYAEKWSPFIRELAVMVVRSVNGKVYSYPVAETVHKNSICHSCFIPARIPNSLQLKATLLAESAVKTLPGCGIFGVEMFELEDGTVIVNEIAPRPHNSGHYTINACAVSQFEAHLRSILDMPMPKNFTDLLTSNTNCIMLNLLGDEKLKNGELQICERALGTPGSSVYLYGKESKPNRKVGHINIVSSSMDDCERKLYQICGESTLFNSPTDCQSFARVEAKSPIVGIIMGSDSDLPVMSAACRILEQFEVPFEVTIVSAHRTPQRMTEYATKAAERGIKSIIAGAGGAAHLPGMIAAMTPLPVIGVPVRGSHLDGVDSLHSIVQMPRGVPVATVAINNSTNAALLAVRMLGSFDAKYLIQMQHFLLRQEEEVLQKAAALEMNGYQNYLDSMK